MTNSTTPNGDRDRPSDCEAAKNLRGLATGRPGGTASSGSTSSPLDMALLCELAKEFGYWPASTHEADIERHSPSRQRCRQRPLWGLPAGVRAGRPQAPSMESLE